MKYNTGIYKIQSKIKPERIYIGSAMCFNLRWNEHRYLLRKNKHHSKIIENHILKYGYKDLEFLIIESFEFISNEHLLSREQYYIDTLKPFFNICKVAGNTSGVKLSNETKMKLSKILTGKIVSAETRLKMSISGKGKNKGKKASDKTRLKLSNDRKKRGLWVGKNNPMYGKKLSGELNGMYGKKHSEETKQKMRGRVITDSERINKSNAHKGLKHSEETKAKIKLNHKSKKYSQENV
jgi:group I intron endonuclease